VQRSSFPSSFRLRRAECGRSAGENPARPSQCGPARKLCTQVAVKVQRVSVRHLSMPYTHFDELFLAHGHAVLNQVRIIGNLRMDDAEHENVPMPQVSNKLKLASSSTMISVQKAWQLIPRLSCSILDVAERFEWLLSRIQTVLPIAAPFASNAAMIRRSKTSQVSTIDPIAISFFCARVASALRALYPLSRLI
jgi:hypothetical protein